MFLSDHQKLGLALTLGGGSFIILGVILFFDRAFMAMGNLLLVAGLPLLLGSKRTAAFLLRKDKLRATICFAIGILLVLFRRTFIGFFVELIGFICLFGDFFPTIVSFLRSIPIIGDILSAPGISHIVNNISGVRFSPV